MPIQLAAVIYAIQSLFFNPTPGGNLAHFALFYLIAKSPVLLLTVVSMYYRLLPRTLPWLPLMYYFSLVKRVANLEALLTFPTRRVTPWHHGSETAHQADRT